MNIRTRNSIAAYEHIKSCHNALQYCILALSWDI